MYRIYEIWKAYALFVVGVLFAYGERTDHLPMPVSLGFLLLPVLAADWFLPRWASLSVFAAVGLPLAWFMGTMFYVFFAYSPNRAKR
jgi:hypothetical protein